MEEHVVAAFIAIITGLIFVSALSRFAGFPLNWAQDVAMLLFAWVVFLGADVALRTVGFIKVDMLVRRFPVTVQKVLHYIFAAMAIALLLVIAYFGTQLAIDHVKRLYQTVGISYSWATASAPVGSVLLIITYVRKLYMNRHDPLVSEGKEAL